ncbi:MAG: hypothetical protein ACXIUW_06205 [Roseinatronobacter sp.]
MGKPLPVELRERPVASVEEGHSHRSAAARFRVSVKFVNDMVILKRETGELEPRAWRQWPARRKFHCIIEYFADRACFA